LLPQKKPSFLKTLQVPEEKALFVAGLISSMDVMKDVHIV